MVICVICGKMYSLLFEKEPQAGIEAAVVKIIQPLVEAQYQFHLFKLLFGPGAEDDGFIALVFKIAQVAGNIGVQTEVLFPVFQSGSE